MNEVQVEKWERTRRRGIGWFCIPRILCIFLIITAIDSILVDGSWVRLVGQLRGDFLLAALAGIVFSIIDWRQNEKRYREHLSEKILRDE